MSKVAAFREAHSEDGVARLQQGQVYRDVGLGSRMRLHVDMLGAVYFFGTVNGNPLDFVYELTSAVIARSGITLGILVGQMAAHGFHDGLTDKIF